MWTCGLAVLCCIVLCFHFGDAAKEEVCYGRLGCFRMDGWFFDKKVRPLQLLPLSPKKIGATLTLHTRHTAPHKLIPGPELANSAFSASRKTKIIVHGFRDNSDQGGWMQEMRKALLQLDDFNVILVDWRRGALQIYTRATANTRVVGAQIADLIRVLQEVMGVNPADVHLIGHSLGAHICGYAGMRTPGLGRITGLDPADPYFQGTHPRVRLDPTDAVFVDVIHTDADHFLASVLDGTGGFGTKEPSGHVDFYPNGGYDQPGCSTKDLIVKTIKEGVINFFEETSAYLGCDHLRAYDVFTASIRAKSSCWFTAMPCASYKDFKKGKCRSCGSVGCGRMGYYADTAIPENRQLVTYYLQTSAEQPFCVHHYFVTFVIRAGQPEVEGTPLIGMTGADGRNTPLTPVSKKKVTFNGNMEYRFLVTAHSGVESIKSIALQWKTKDGPQLMVKTLVVDLVRNDLSEERSVFHLQAPLLAGKVLYATKND